MECTVLEKNNYTSFIFLIFKKPVNMGIKQVYNKMLHFVCPNIALQYSRNIYYECRIFCYFAIHGAMSYVFSFERSGKRSYFHGEYDCINCHKSVWTFPTSFPGCSSRNTHISVLQMYPVSRSGKFRFLFIWLNYCLPSLHPQIQYWNSCKNGSLHPKMRKNWERSSFMMLKYLRTCICYYKVF